MPAPENSKSGHLVLFCNIDSPTPETIGEDESVTESDSEEIQPSTPAPENSKSGPLVLFCNIDTPTPETIDEDESITESDSEWIRALTLAPEDNNATVSESKGEIELGKMNTITHHLLSSYCQVDEA